MRMKRAALLAVATIAAMGPFDFGQNPARATRTTIKPPQQQTPFTAEFKIVTVRTLANGTTITQESTELQAADSQGRHLAATTVAGISGEQQTRSSVYDPVAATSTDWGTESRKAFVLPHTPSTAPRDCVPGIPKRVPPEARRRTSMQEDLGNETIQGIEVHGVKTTVTVPAGAVGNNEPLVSTHEAWQAVNIKPSPLIVRQVDDDPVAGHSTREMTSVMLSEPDASIFQPPQGYEIVTRDAPLAPCPGGQVPVRAN